MSIIKDYVIVQPKSKIKAGEGLIEGKYKFFTSSNTQTKWLNEFYYDKPALILGTGGMASVHYCDTPFSTSTDCIVMYAKDSTNLEYIYHYLESHMEVLEDGFKGAGLKHISKDYILNIQIPEKELLEQKKIVDLCNNIDLIVAASKKQLEKLDELVKARFIEMFGDPKCNDKGFATVLGESLFKLSNGKTLPNSKRFSKGIPAYGGNGISWYTDEVLCDYDTIIVGRVGFQSGNVHLAKAPLWVTDNAMFISNINSKDCDIRFLCTLMEHIDFTRYQDAGDLKKITQKPFMQMQYLMPPIDLQKQYIDFVEQTDKSKFEVQQSLEKLETLKKSLMQQYFG